MTSKEALENIKTAPSFMGGNPRYWTCLESRIPFLEDIETIKQDLDKLETFDYITEQNVELREENKKLKQALDKACEKCMKFDKCPPITCIELYEDNDNVCKECWKKYFMKEVLKND